MLSLKLRPSTRPSAGAPGERESERESERGERRGEKGKRRETWGRGTRAARSRSLLDEVAPRAALTCRIWTRRRPGRKGTRGTAAPRCGGGTDEDKPPPSPRQILLDVSGEMALSSAPCSVLPLWLLWGAACAAAAAAAAAGNDHAFPFDIEGSSAVGRQEPPESSEPRVAPGSLPPAAKVQCPCPCHPAAAPAPRGLRAPLACP